jgi:hypothetical protein
MLPDSWSEAGLPKFTLLLDPLNDKAFPNLPLIQVAPLIVPLAPLPDMSVSFLPLPSLNE